MHELSMSLMALSCWAPGFISFLSGVITSHVECKVEAVWQQEYTLGRTNEIFSLTVPDAYEGHTFRQLVKDYYRKYHVIVFGLRVSEDEVGAGSPTVLFPPTYRLRRGQLVWGLGTLDQLSRANAGVAQDDVIEDEVITQKQ